MKIIEKIGRRIKQFRKLRGLTQEELARLTNLSVQYIGAIERGERSASISSLNAISEALGISLKDLFKFGEEEKVKSKKYYEMVIEELIRELRNKTPETIMLIGNLIKRLK